MSARMRTMSVSFSPFSFLERSRPLYFRGIWRARSRKYLKQLLFLAFLSLKGTKWEWPPIGRRMERSRPKCQREWTFYKGSKDPHSPLGFLGGGGKLFKGKVLYSQGGWTQALEPQHTPPKHGIEGTALGLILLIVLFKWSESKMNSFLLYRSVSFNTCIGSCNQDGWRTVSHPQNSTALSLHSHSLSPPTTPQNHRFVCHHYSSALWDGKKNGIIQQVSFWDWFLSFRLAYLGLIHVLLGINGSFCFSLSNVPLCGFTRVSLFFCLLKDIWVVFRFWLSQIKLLWTSVYRFLYDYISFL